VSSALLAVRPARGLARDSPRTQSARCRDHPCLRRQMRTRSPGSVKS
jgi:hypothetical protein